MVDEVSCVWNSSGMKSQHYPRECDNFSHCELYFPLLATRILNQSKFRHQDVLRP